MKQRLGWIAIAVLVLMIPFTLAVMQDDASISLDIIGLDASDLPVVVANTSVLDDKGQLISGLGVEHFSIIGELAEIGTVTKVENVTDDNLAFASVLVIDTSSSMVGAPLEEAQEAARNYIGALGVNDPVAIMSFDTTVRLVQDYTTDKELLLNAINNLAFGGQTALYDATLASIELADRAPLPRKAVVILSDGGEYGGVSSSTREDSFQASTVNGVPVYTVGLGWQIDRRFLEVISEESNAQFYASPTPEELIDIYNNLAFLFRTQYIVTMNLPVPADGTRYNFGLEVTTPDGQTASSEGILRAPIPKPILSLPEGLFSEPITGATTVTVDVLADDEIASTEYRIGDEVVSSTESYTIDPVTFAPGTYTLDVTVADVDGDTTDLSADFTIAALPPTVESDFAPAAGTELSEPQLITVTGGGQTAITGVDFLIDNVVVASDTEAPYEFELDPFTVSPGGHILSIQVTNAGGVSTTVDTAFAAATLPPQLAITGITTETVLSDTLSGNVVAVGQSSISSLSVTYGETTIAEATDTDTLDFTLNAVDFAPGTATIAITSVDSNGATSTETISFGVSTLPPTVEISGLEADAVITGDVEVTVNAGGQTDITLIDVGYDDATPSTIVGNTFTIPANTLGDGDHEVTVVVTNAGGQSESVSVPFVVNLPPTPTFTPTATFTSTPTDTPTNTPVPTDTDVPTETAVPTDTDVPTDTVEPTETNTDVPTEAPTDTPDATETAVANAEVEAQETADAQLTLDAENTQTAESELTVVAQETLDMELTEAAQNIRATADARGTQQSLDITSTVSAMQEATDTAEESASIQLTDDAEAADATATAEAEVAINETETSEAEEAVNETETSEAEEAVNETETAEAEEANQQATVEAEEAANAVASEEAATETASASEPDADASEEATTEDGAEDPTEEPTAETSEETTDIPPTSTELPTEEGVVEPTAQPSLTPVVIEDVDSPSADQQETSDNSTVIVAVGAGLLLLILLFLGLRRRND